MRNDEAPEGGLLVVVAGPSGVGKGTVLAHVLAAIDDAEISVSSTTRRPRPGEVDGRHYHFLDPEAFAISIEDGDFLEWAEYAGNHYGTSRRAALGRVAEGAVVILEIEVQGADQVRERVPDALLVFLAPPSMDELERRLRSRATEGEAELATRLQIARDEMAAADRFDVTVVNDDVERAARDIIDLIRSARRGVR